MNDYYDVRIKRANLARLKNGWGDRVIVYEGDISNESFVQEVRRGLCVVAVAVVCA